jgi:hypothetical protein
MRLTSGKPQWLTTPLKSEDYQADDGMDDSLLFSVISVKCLSILSLVRSKLVIETQTCDQNSNS